MSISKYSIIALLFSSICSITQAATETLNLSATIEAPTCDLNVVGGSNGIVDLGEVEITDFEKKNILTQHGKAFVLQLTNCKGAGWGNLKPTLKINGDQEDVTGNGIFRTASQSSSKNIGILLKYGASDYSQANELTNVPFYWEIGKYSDKVPNEQSYSFWLGLSRVGDYSQTRAGTVSANINFSFEWH